MAKKRRTQERAASSSEEDGDEIYDEVDKFHQERDKEILNDLKKEKKKPRQEEVLAVVASEGDVSDSDEDMYKDSDDDSDDSVDERLSKKKKGGTEAVASADAWGKKKIDYYGSHADKDYGGWDEEEAEALELEEEDAISRQKKLDAAIDAVDIAGFLASDDEEEAPKVNKAAKKQPETTTKPELLNKEEQRAYMIKHSSNFDSFAKEYNNRKSEFDELKPTLTSILTCMKDYDCPFTRQIKAIIAAYTQYLQCYYMFFYLKDTTPIEKFKSIENHPVLDNIMKQYLILQQIDTFVETNYRRLMKVADRLKEDPSYAEVIANPEPPKKKRRSEEIEEVEPTIEDIGDVFARMARGENRGKGKAVAPFGPALDDGEYPDDDDEKRKITYEMQKNKGLTVKRKKGISHSRTKKRLQYKKAIHIRRSQVPDVQREVSKYGGEHRGIRASTVRSIKLKA